MISSEALGKVLPLFDRYYVLNTETPAEPFAAEAVFDAKDEHYAVYKNIKIGEVDCREYIFFATVDKLGLEEAKALDERAWAEGIGRVHPSTKHKNTDVAIVVLANEVSAEAGEYYRKLHRHKSYKLMFNGWSNYRAVVIETTTGRMVSNRLGHDLQKLFSNIGFIV